MTTTTPDQIRLSGLSARGYHGVLPFERTEGQLFTADVTLDLGERGTAVASVTDAVKDAVDYSEVARAVVAVIEGEPVSLIETLAARVGEAVLAFPRVTAVEVTIHKPQAPLDVAFEDVSVTIHRTGGEGGNPLSGHAPGQSAAADAVTAPDQWGSASAGSPAAAAGAGMVGAAGDAAQGDAVLEVGHQGVAGPQADGDQGGGQAQDAGVLAAHGDQNVALVQALLDGDEFTDVVRLGRGHRVEALIEDEGGTGLQAAQRQCGRGRHPHPPSGHDDVDGAGHGVDDGHMRGEGERGRRQALDLLLGGRQLPAGRCQGAGQAAVLAHEHVGVGSARIGWGDSGGFDGPGWFSSAGCCGGGVGGAPGTGIGTGAMRLRGCRFALIHVLLLRLGGGRRPSENRSGTLVPERG